MRKHKYDKFKSDGLRLIRWDMLEGGGVVAFLVPGVLLTLSQKNVDFDNEADLLIGEILKKDRLANSKFCYEYDEFSGFIEVDPKNQNWFKF